MEPPKKPRTKSGFPSKRRASFFSKSVAWCVAFFFGRLAETKRKFRKGGKARIEGCPAELPRWSKIAFCQGETLVLIKNARFALTKRHFAGQIRVLSRRNARFDQKRAFRLDKTRFRWSKSRFVKAKRSLWSTTRVSPRRNAKSCHLYVHILMITLPSAAFWSTDQGALLGPCQKMQISMSAAVGVSRCTCELCDYRCTNQ